MSAPRRDEGSALIVVLGAMTVLSLLVSVTLSYALRTSDTAVRANAWNQAFAAAESGVDDYLARLNRDDLYWRTVDCTNAALRKKYTTGAPCGWGAASTTTGWLPVPGPDTAAEFHYDVDVTSTPVNGTIALTSTGRSSGITRSIQVTLRRGGFGEFLYYTVYETKDPADYPDPTTAMDKCAHYYWEPTTSVSKPRDTSYCTDINFVGGDKINGPLHSNDAMVVGADNSLGVGPWFQGTATTSWPQCRPVNGVLQPASRCYRKSVTNPHPRFDKGIGYRSEIELPTSIGDLRQYVDAAQTPSPGCLYTGPTRIVFNPTVGSATPTMKVWSNWSKGTLNPGCGNPAASWPQTINVPQNKLIMVQDVPSGQSTPSSGPCATGAIGDGLPVANDFSNTLGEANCRYGSAYVEGTLKGRVTISVDNNIVVTDDLTYSGGENGTDALGLIAENSVQIYHPVLRTCDHYDWRGRCDEWSDYRNANGPKGTLNTDPKVQAAILTLQHSFEVQAYDVGAKLGSIKLFGTIAQRFRGIVGQGGSTGTGYLKDYNYDSRLRYAPPPYFLDPVRSSWGQKTFGEVTPRYPG